MFVSESNIFDPGNIKIKVSSMDGTDVILEVCPDITVDHLKIQISSHLYDPVECVKTSLYHRILHVNSGAMLEEEKTLIQCGVKDQDELLLIRKRVPGPTLEGIESRIREDSRKTPTVDDVKQATQGIPSRNTERQTAADQGQGMNFKEELRKILVSLIHAAQKILCLNPEAAKIFEEAERYMSDQASMPVVSEPVIDQTALDQLVAMGFPQPRARKALIINQMSTELAIQWLVEHDNDPDIDLEPDTEKTSPEVSPRNDAPDNTTPCSSAEGATASEEPCNQALKLAQMSGPDKVKKMLESFRTYRRREFRANPKALKMLTEMGFQESDALDGLCIHGNKQEEACDWLLSGGHLTHYSEIDLEGGLDPDGPVYKAIMASPVVQLGLSHPKSLLAFLTILENPNSTQQWLNDPDTGPMLIQISRIYHAERHAKPSTSSTLAST